jgi:hypothetical protein
METRNMVTMFMASTPNRAKPRSTSIASIRSDGLTGFGGALLAVEPVHKPILTLVIAGISPFAMESFERRVVPRQTAYIGQSLTLRSNAGSRLIRFKPMGGLRLGCPISFFPLGGSNAGTGHLAFSVG